MDGRTYYLGLVATRPYLPLYDDLSKAQQKYVDDQVARRQRAIDKLTQYLSDVDHVTAGTIYVETHSA